MGDAILPEPFHFNVQLPVWRLQTVL